MNAFEADQAIQLAKWREEHGDEEPEMCAGDGTFLGMCWGMLKGHAGPHYVAR
jgi:hypothetical protein